MGILFDMGGFILMFITGNGLNYMLLSYIFKEETDAPLDRSQGINGRLKQLSKRKTVDEKFRINYCDLLCRRCKTSKVTKSRMERGEDRFGQELDIATFIAR